MKTQIIYKLSGNIPMGLSITGDHSHVSVEATNELIEKLGGIETAFHRIKAAQGKNLLPRMGSVARPLTPWDWALFEKNTELERKHYKYFSSIIRGNQHWYGYGYETNTHIVLIDREFKVWEKFSK